MKTASLSNLRSRAACTRGVVMSFLGSWALSTAAAVPDKGNPYLSMIWQAVGNLLHQPVILGVAGLAIALAVFRLIPKGKRGELAVVALKKAFLDKETYIDLNDVTLNTPSGTTQIDHVIVSRYGIFVIETKNMTGWIFGSERQAEWTQSLPGGRKFRFQNPLHQNARHVRVLKEFLDLPPQTLHSIVLFIGDAEFKRPMPANVMTGGFVTYIKAKQDVVFTEDQVASIVQALKNGRMAPGSETHRAHLASLAQRHTKTAENI
jgi:restriction system protein